MASSYFLLVVLTCWFEFPCFLNRLMLPYGGHYRVNIMTTPPISREDKLIEVVEAIEAADDYQGKLSEPNIEFRLTKDKRMECRDIVLELRERGLSQRQFLYLIQILAVELENVSAMKAIVAAVGENRENIPLAKEEDYLANRFKAEPAKKKIIVE